MREPPARIRRDVDVTVLEYWRGAAGYQARRCQELARIFVWFPWLAGRMWQMEATWRCLRDDLGRVLGEEEEDDIPG